VFAFSAQITTTASGTAHSYSGVGSTYVVGGCQSAVRPADLAPGFLQTLKGLGRGHFVHKVPVCPGIRQDLSATTSCVVWGDQPM
jgi:Ni,Fe-hydrogenase I small subunit